MASHQAQGPDPLRSRSSHIGYLTKQCNAIDYMITGIASHAEAVAAQKALHHRYKSYLESHEFALASIPDPNTLTQSHVSTAERHNLYCDKILTYIQTLDVSEESTHSHRSRASKPSPATRFAHSSTPSRKSLAAHSTRSRVTRLPSQVSKSSSARLSESKQSWRRIVWKG